MLFTCTGFPLVPQTYRLIPILRSLQELSSLSGKPFTQPFSARLDPFTITIGPKVPSPDRTSAVLYLLSLDTLFYFFFYHYLKFYYFSTDAPTHSWRTCLQDSWNLVRGFTAFSSTSSRVVLSPVGTL